MLASRASRPLLFAASVLLCWFAFLYGVGRAAGLVEPGQQYNVPLWIARHLPRMWLNGPARRLGGGYGAASDPQLVDFFGQTAALAAAERDDEYAQAYGQTDPQAETAITTIVKRLRTLQAPVQARLTAELSATVRQQRLDARLPVGGRHLVWPPVDFAFDLPPYVLILARRDRIGLIGTSLLRGDLGQEGINRLERDAERRGLSALVVRIGGVATYPSIVEEDDGYADSLDLIAHEWTHQYLFFHPLGVRYFASPDLTTINETVANMAGRELAANARSGAPLPASVAVARSTAPPPDRAVDFNRTLHSLRVDVDHLLAQGDVAEAERRMNETQRFLAEHGYYIRRLNQAYFAFYGTYADTAASTNPLGPQLAELRQRYSNLRDFLHAAQNLTSAAALQRLLSESRR